MGNCEKKKASTLGNEDFLKKQQSNFLSKLLTNSFLNMSWEDLKVEFIIDEKYGCSFDPEFVPLDSYYNPWIDFALQIPQFIEQKQVQIQILPQMKLDKLQNIRQQLRIYTLLCLITNAYLFNDLENIPQTLPQNIAHPLYILSQALQIKPSSSWAQQFCNWKQKDTQVTYLEPTNLSLRYSYTKDQNEQIYFLLANITDFRMATALRAGYEANQKLLLFFLHNIYQLDFSLISSILQTEENQINQISIDQLLEKEKLQQTLFQPIFRFLFKNEKQIEELVIKQLLIMAEEMIQLGFAYKNIYSYMKPEFFFHVLRRFLQGFSNEKFFPKGLFFEGVQLFIKTDGYSGNSPSLQIYERLIGLQVDGQLEKLQEAMRAGMINKHRELINFCSRNSLLRFYAYYTQNQKIKLAYNQAVEASIKFNETHQNFLTYYFEKQLEQQSPSVNLGNLKAANDVPFSEIKKKHLLFQKFLIQVN